MNSSRRQENNRAQFVIDPPASPNFTSDTRRHAGCALKGRPVLHLQLFPFYCTPCFIWWHKRQCQPRWGKIDGHCVPCELAPMTRARDKGGGRTAPAGFGRASAVMPPALDASPGAQGVTISAQPWTHGTLVAVRIKLAPTSKAVRLSIHWMQDGIWWRSGLSSGQIANDSDWHACEV